MPADPYQPTSRRPIADVFRLTARAAVRACVRAGVHPDTVSYSSIAAAAAGGLLFALSGQVPWLLLVAPLPCYLRLWLNMLDGMVALASGKASKRGEVVNELPDRLSDIAVFGGVALAGPWVSANGVWALWAAIAAVMTAYVGVTGQAVGVGRQYGGVMAKPWRMVCLHAGAWATFALWAAGRPTAWGGLTVLDWTCAVVIVGCVQTCGVRLAKIWRGLA